MWSIMEIIKFSLFLLTLVVSVIEVEAASEISFPWTDVKFKTEGGETLIAEIRDDKLDHLFLEMPGFSLNFCYSALEGISSPDLSSIVLKSSFGGTLENIEHSLTIEMPFYINNNERIVWFVINSDRSVERWIWKTTSKIELVEQKNILCGENKAGESQSKVSAEIPS